MIITVTFSASGYLDHDRINNTDHLTYTFNKVLRVEQYSNLVVPMKSTVFELLF